MSYSCSSARQKASTRIRGLRGPFIYAKIRTKKLPTHVRDAIFQNCVFQLSAAFEDFLYDLISRWFSSLQTGNAANSRLPPLTRALALIKSQEENFRRYTGDKNEVALAKKTIVDRDLFSIFVDSDPIPPMPLEDLIIKDKKFPSLRNFNTLFRRLGMPKTAHQINRRIKSDFELSLQSFMDVRNALAHESPPSVTDQDVERYLSQVDRWIKAIDREFYSHVVATSGAAYWH